MTVKDLKEEALRLEPADRAMLARELLSSLEALSEPEVWQLWLAEAVRRDRDLETGTASAAPVQEVLSRVLARRA